MTTLVSILLKQLARGKKDTRQLAAAIDRDTRQTVGLLRFLRRRGQIVKIRNGGMGRYGRPSVWAKVEVEAEAKAS